VLGRVMFLIMVKSRFKNNQLLTLNLYDLSMRNF